MKAKGKRKLEDFRVNDTVVQVLISEINFRELWMLMYFCLCMLVFLRNRDFRF